MGQSVVRTSSRTKIFSQPGSDPSLANRVTVLENNVYKVTYYEIISGASGSITIPTGATINADEFGLSGNCVLSEIDGSNKPTYQSPQTAVGVVVTSSLNTSTGAWVKSGVTTSTNVALIYSINISALQYNNLNTFYVIDTVQKDDIVSQTIANGDTYHAPSSDAVFDALELKNDIEVASTTGVALTFTKDQVYGSIATPETGNITFSPTGAKLGVTNLIIHNHTSAPTFGANMKKLSGSGDYVINTVNYIYISYINSAEVIYSINQRT